MGRVSTFAAKHFRKKLMIKLPMTPLNDTRPAQSQRRQRYVGTSRLLSIPFTPFPPSTGSIRFQRSTSHLLLQPFDYNYYKTKNRVTSLAVAIGCSRDIKHVNRNFYRDQPPALLGWGGVFRSLSLVSVYSEGSFC